MPISTNSRSLLIALALLLCAPSQAIVYNLKPDASPASLRKALRAEVVVDKPVVVNGLKGTMHVAVTELEWGRLLDELKLLLTDFEVRENADNIVLDGLGESGTRVRHLIVRGPPGKLTTIFTMTLPDEAAASDLERLWPDAFPMPQDAKVETVISMADTGVEWLQFQTVGDARQLLVSYQERILGAGWKRLASDDERSLVCVSPDQSHMAIVAVRPGQDVCYGSVFLRRIK
jgi:hypothetical protein